MNSTLVDTTRSVRTYLILGVLLLNAIVFSVAIMNLMASRERSVEAVRLTTNNLGNILADNLAHSAQKIDLALLSLADNLELTLKDKRWSDKYVNALLAVHDGRHPEVLAFRLTDREGVMRWGKGFHQRAPISLADRDHFKFHRESAGSSLHVSDPIQMRLEPTWAIIFSRPYRHPDGSFAGIVTAAMPLTYLYEQLARLDLGPHGSVVIRHSINGALVTRHPPANGPGGEVGNKKISPEFKAVIESGDESGSFFTPRAPDGMARTYAFRRIKGMPMIVNVGMAPEDYLTTWHQEVRNTVLLLTGFMILSVLASLLLLRFWQRIQLDTALLLAGESRFRTYIDAAPEGIFVADDQGRYVDVNPAACEMVGYTRDELLGMTIIDLSPEGEERACLQQFEDVKKGDLPELEITLQRKDGQKILGLLRTIALEDGRVVGFCIDITARRRADETIQLYAKMFEHIGEALIITDRNNCCLAVNDRFTQMTGYTLEEVRGRNPKLLASGKTPPETYQAMWAALLGSGLWEGELWDRRKDGSTYPKWTTISTIRNAEGEITHYIASFTDISERKAAEARIEKLAHHDALTGLLNRYSLESRLEQALLSARREGNLLGVLFIDMDRFKVINDTLGHAMGDCLLQEVASRLQGNVRESDIVARQGGDEFVVVLTHLESPNTVIPLVEKLQQALTQPYVIRGVTLHSSPSIGVAIFPDDADCVPNLMKNADTAMYAAKQSGRNSVHYFRTSLMAAAAERLLIE